MDEKNLLTFKDENDVSYNLEMIDSFEYGDKVYVALLPPEEEDEEDTEVLIMRIETDESGEDVLVYVDDDDEIDGAFETLKARMSDEYDFLD